MQNSLTAPHSWRELIWLALASILTFLLTRIPSPFKSRQSKADTAKTEAETRSIGLHDTIQGSEFILDLLKQVAESTAHVERLRAQMEFWQDRAGAFEAEVRILEKQLDERIRIGDGK